MRRFFWLCGFWLGYAPQLPAILWLWVKLWWLKRKAARYG